jgi:hypothetical protein
VTGRDEFIIAEASRNRRDRVRAVAPRRASRHATSPIWSRVVQRRAAPRARMCVSRPDFQLLVIDLGHSLPLLAIAENTFSAWRSRNKDRRCRLARGNGHRNLPLLDISASGDSTPVRDKSCCRAIKTRAAKCSVAFLVAEARPSGSDRRALD